MPKCTETIDKLFLELSQVTRAMTAKEIALRDALQRLLDAPERMEHGESAADIAERCAAREQATAILAKLEAA